MKNGLPIYASGDYKGDVTIDNVKSGRDERLQLFVWGESDLMDSDPAAPGVGIDQLSLMNESINSREQKRIQYANITMDLYKLSAKYGIPIVLNVQAGRAAKDSGADVIQLEHIAESDGVGQNASRVITMQRDEANGILRLSVVKNRYGEDNKTIEYIWDVTSGTYTLIGYKSDDDNGEESSSPVNLKARQSSRKLQNQVSREGVEAF
jgi:hypothetical protein